MRWKLLHKTPEGHRWFKAPSSLDVSALCRLLGLSREQVLELPVVADRSGHTPELTDDGILFLDPRRPCEPYVSSTGSLAVAIPLVPIDPVLDGLSTSGQVGDLAFLVNNGHTRNVQLSEEFETLVSVCVGLRSADEHPCSRLSPAELIARCQGDWNTPIVGAEIAEQAEGWTARLTIKKHRGDMIGFFTVYADEDSRGAAIQAMIESSPWLARDMGRSPKKQVEQSEASGGDQ